MPNHTKREELLVTLYSAAYDSSLWGLFLSQFATFLGISKAALMIHHFPRQPSCVSAAFGDAVRESIPAYEKYYYQFDEWTLRFRKLAPKGPVFRGREIWPDDQLKKRTFYNDFLEPFDTCEIAGIVGRNTATNLEALSIYRGPRERPFDEKHFAGLRSLAQHWNTALAMRRRLLALESRMHHLEDALDQLDTALVVLDLSARLVFANRAARKLSACRDGLELTSTRLSARNASENNRLRSMVARAVTARARGDHQPAGAIFISRAGKCPLQIFAAPLQSFRYSQAPVGAVVLFISDPDRKTVIPVEILRDLYDITPAEARLASLLLSGRSLRELAHSLGVSYETIRSQMKSLYQKTGTRSQSSLVGMLSKLGVGSGSIAHSI